MERVAFHLKHNARSLRRDATEPERRLWSRLRGLRADGLRFRRQHVVGDYIVDFACTAAKVVVEIDGSDHVDREGLDARRDRWLQARGWKVLRYTNLEVITACEDVTDQIARLTQERLP